MGIIGCDKKPMPGKKPMPPKERRMSNPASKHHPRETRGSHPPGKGEPRMKQHSDDTHQKQEFQSEPHPPQHG